MLKLYLLKCLKEQFNILRNRLICCEAEKTDITLKKESYSTQKLKTMRHTLILLKGDAIFMPAPLKLTN